MRSNPSGGQSITFNNKLPYKNIAGGGIVGIGGGYGEASAVDRS